LEAETDVVVFSDTILVDINDETFLPSKYLPNLTEAEYYFKVNFPQRPLVPSLMITIWATAIIILTTVIIFFTYTLFVIFRQQRLSEFQNNFINNLAHEFKTPLSTIGISANVLAEPGIIQEPERLKVYSSIILLENERLKGQVNKILELAKLENREVVLRHEPIDVCQMIEELIPSFMVQLDARQGTLVRECPDAPCIVQADKVHLRNVINTLLDNALKYTEAAPKIVLGVHCSDKMVHISVSDNGIGISKEYHRRIFEKFFRVPTGDVHNVKGYGLGLSYVNMIAKASNWKLGLQSELNKGSTFTIGIPLNHENNNEYTEETQNPVR
jgi:two-component system phosphate regulon sensor histidine kinase PhoR